MGLEIDEITETIIGCAFIVSNTLGAGFLEKVYENALALEIQKAGLVENGVLVELIAVKDIDNIHMAQCMNYLKATV